MKTASAWTLSFASAFLLLAAISSLLIPCPLHASATFSGQLPSDLVPEVQSGQVFFYLPDQTTGWRLLKTADVPVQKDGAFSARADFPNPEKQDLRAEFYFPSEDYIPFTAYGSCPANQTVGTLQYSDPVRKKYAAHFTGTVIDGATGSPIPWVEISQDGGGTHLARADQNGHFDFWTEVLFGQAQFNPYIGTHVGETFQMPADPGASYHFNIPLEPGVNLRVRTVDENGKPVTGVAISFMGGGATGGWIGDSGEAVMGKLSAYRPTHIGNVDKPGWILAQDPGAIYSAFYTQTPLIIRLQPGSHPILGLIPPSLHSGRAPVRIVRISNSPFYLRVVMPGFFILMALFFLGIAARAWIFRHPFLISQRWLLAIVVLAFLPGLLNPVLFSPHATHLPASLLLMELINPLMLLCLILYFWFQMRGYMIFAVTNQSFKEAFQAAAAKLGYTVEESIATLRLMPANISVKVNVQDWLGTGQVRPDSKNRALVANLVHEMNTHFAIHGGETNQVTTIFYGVIGLFMLLSALALAGLRF
jgi:hypothetical protein